MLPEKLGHRTAFNDVYPPVAAPEATRAQAPAAEELGVNRRKAQERQGLEDDNTDQIAVAVADLVRHPRDPAAMLKRAGEFAFPMFKQNLLAALNG